MGAVLEAQTGAFSLHRRQKEVFMIAKYSTKCWGDTFTVAADWGRAASPVREMPGRQVADFRHSPERAMRALLEGEAILSGAIDRECRREITLAVKSMREV